MDTPPNDENATPSVPPVPPPPPAPGTRAQPVPPVPPAPDSGQPRISLGDTGATAFPTAPAAAAKPLWKRIPTKFVVIGVIVLGFVLFGVISNLGKTSADDLDAGDCFALPGDEVFTDVKDQSCDGLHNAEIYAKVEVDSSVSYPGFDILGSATAAIDNACGAAVETLTINEANLTADFEEGVFFADREGWDDGDRTILCYVSSAQGFPGPVIARE